MTLVGIATAGRDGGAQKEHEPVGTAYTGVNIVDLTTGRIIPNQTVVVAGKTISAIQDATIPLDPELTVLPSLGKYVMPGLWDMHVHVAHENYLDLFVANGITGVRDMGGGLEQAGDGCETVGPSILRRWRSEVAAGKRVSPELVISGPAVSGTGWPSSLPARTSAEAKAAVSALKRHRVDFLKVYERIPWPAYHVLAASAKRTGLTFAGHVPEEVGPLTAIRAGQRSIEHIPDALLVCFTNDRAALNRFFDEHKWGEKDRKWGRAAHAACPAIIAALQINEVWLTPTLTVEKAKISVDDPRHVADRRRRTLPRSVRDGYSEYVKGKLAQSAADRTSERLWWRTQQELVRRMSGAGASRSQPIHTSASSADCFLPDECAYLMRRAEPLLKPSLIDDPAKGTGRPDPIRTSHGAAFVPNEEDLVVQTLNRRIAEASGTRVSNAEALYVLRYTPGQEYKPHLDALAGLRNQREWTAIAYLNDAFEGGATVFPELGLSLRPEPGDLLLFRNSDGDGGPDLRMRHAGQPVSSGEKWIATRWIRHGPHDPYDRG